MALTPFDPVILGGVAFAAVSVFCSLLGVSTMGHSIGTGAGHPSKRGLDEDVDSVVFLLDKNSNVTNADMEVLHGMVIQPLPPRPKKDDIQHVLIENQVANVSGYGWITGPWNRQNEEFLEHGMYVGKLSVFFSDNMSQEVTGHWVYVDPDHADKDAVEAFQNFTKSVKDSHNHRQVLWNLIDQAKANESEKFKERTEKYRERTGGA